MIASIKAEILKLVTIRSTYVILGLAFILELLFAFYGSGWRAQAFDLAGNHNYIASQVTSALAPLTVLAGLIAVLLITHEYRYNTILHTLTSNRSRTVVFISKILVISGFAVLFSLFFGWLSPVLTIFGIKLHGHTIVTQYIPVWSLTWRTMFYGWGFSMLALILAFIIRIQVGAIAALFIIPGVVESIIGLLLKQNQVYLPFTALSVLLGGDRSSQVAHISFERSATVVLIYIVIGWVVAWYLFLKRDAG